MPHLYPELLLNHTCYPVVSDVMHDQPKRQVDRTKELWPGRWTVKQNCGCAHGVCQPTSDGDHIILSYEDTVWSRLVKFARWAL